MFRESSFGSTTFPFLGENVFGAGFLLTGNTFLLSALLVEGLGLDVVGRCVPNVKVKSLDFLATGFIAEHLGHQQQDADYNSLSGCHG